MASRESSLLGDERDGWIGLSRFEIKTRIKGPPEFGEKVLLSVAPEMLEFHGGELLILDGE